MKKTDSKWDAIPCCPVESNVDTTHPSGVYRVRFRVKRLRRTYEAPALGAPMVYADALAFADECVRRGSAAVTILRQSDEEFHPGGAGEFFLWQIVK